MFVYNHPETIECVKSSQLFKKIQTLWVNNSRGLRVKNGKFSGYYFYVN